MDALDALQAQGRKVGVITHVEELKERIPTQGGLTSIILQRFPFLNDY